MLWIFPLGVFSCVPKILGSCVLVSVCLKVPLDSPLEVIVNASVVQYRVLWPACARVPFSSCLFRNCFPPSYHCGRGRCSVWFRSSWIYWDLFCVLTGQILETVSRVLEKNVHSAALGWNALETSIKSFRASATFKADVSLLNFLVWQIYSLMWWGALKSPAMTVWLLISPISVREDLLCRQEVPCCVHKCPQGSCPLVASIPLARCACCLSLLSPHIAFVFKSIVSDTRIAAPAFLFVCFHLCEMIFHPFTFSLCVCLLIWGGSLVDCVYMGHVFLSIRLSSVFWLEPLLRFSSKSLFIGKRLLPFYSL